MKRTLLLYLLILATISLCACQPKEKKPEAVATKNPTNFTTGSFGYDLHFLKSRDSIIVLKNASGEGQIIVSAKFQGKVFTSTTDGLAGKSIGWINYKAFDAEKDRHMNAYGGENRLWFGPEGGKYSVFFKPGAKMVFENWATPPSVDTEAWDIVSKEANKVSLQKEATLLNYVGTELKTKVKREIQILNNDAIAQMLNIDVGKGVKAVGYRTNNALTNAGSKAWTKETGAPCLWMLDMFKVSPATTIVIPYHNQGTFKIATTNYFGEIPLDRIAYQDGVLLFKADGQMRGKLGLAPNRAKPVAGSYAPDSNLLTIATFDVDNKGTYLNQEWTTAKDPLKGDAVNAYNDGPLEDGSQMGAFYEIESVSPAAFLNPGEVLHHQHYVFHFTGDKNALNQISQKVLGISLENIQNTFRK